MNPADFDEIPKKAKEKKLAQAWDDAELIDELNKRGVDIPDLIRKALRIALQKTEPGKKSR